MAEKQRPAVARTEPITVVSRQPRRLVIQLAMGPEAKVTPIWRALIVEVSPLPHWKYSLNLGRKTPKLYMTPSPITLPMKQASTAIQPQNPPSGATVPPIPVEN